MSKSATNIDDLPNSIENINNHAFAFCSNLNEIILKDGIKTIGYASFYYSNNLKRVRIPNSVTKIFNGAFVMANNLTEIIIHKQRGEIAGEPWGAVYGTRVIQYNE